jgi:glucosamine--fructose-6-phosphate aminotransferase (isomerizing)
MCGIIAVVRRPSRREPPTSAEVLAGLDAATGRLITPDADLVSAVSEAADHLERTDVLLRGAPGLVALVGDAGLRDDIADRVRTLEARVAEIEIDLDRGEELSEQQESASAGLVRVKDAVWAIARDRLGNAEAVATLAGEGATTASIEAYASIQVALSAIDRLEVRGRDSAGLHLLIERHGLDLDDPSVVPALAERSDPLFVNGSVRAAGENLSFVYKAAAEIGELGDNTRALRSAIAGDDLLRRALASPTAQATVLGHTRWASVGIISQANAHPLNQEEAGRRSGCYITAALNGDVDNYAELRSAAHLEIPPEITTDAKVIPALTARRRDQGADLVDAFRETVAAFDGSVAIGASAAEAPGQILLALRGSGQALYVGLAEDTFIVASEPYGLVEETPRYLRMDGETPSGRDGSSGQVIVIDREGAGTVDGIRRLAYDGTELPVAESEVTTAEITTRDIDRAGAPHFLLKEIGEAPRSVQKTLRGKVVDRGGLLSVVLPTSALPAAVRTRLGDGSITRVLAIGQGTAAVAAQSVAATLDLALADAPIIASASLATELSGFGLRDDMSDTLIIPISQSGTTTDTNRTVDLARARGAAVVAIVNRRNSDLVEKSDGVLYTSDGRDVEMAVPSTKAFYAQVTAGYLLSLAIADAAGVGDRQRAHDLLTALRALPAAMEHVLLKRDEIAGAAQAYAPSRRYWALVGNGLNRIAAQELRIKLSELCYKSIAFDATEDKKHIDLSAEPLILVCAAGLPPATADDVAKEIAIYRAHKAAPIVIASEGEGRFGAALQVIEVPSVHPAVDFVLAAMAGHLFGYEAALAIDAQARQLRETRAVLDEALEQGGTSADLLDRIRADLEPHAARFFAGLREGAFNGNLEASTAVSLSSLLLVAVGTVPLEAYEVEHGRLGSPAAVVSDLLQALNRAIDELTRPIDAIKHQAKTVTVGISRAEESFADISLIRQLLATGTPRDRLMYRSLRTLAELDPAVAEVAGYTRYQIDTPASGPATVHVVDKGGVAQDLRSRTEGSSVLRGTKHRVATEREVTVARGLSDGRTIIIVPEVKDNQVTGLSLLHVRFHDRVPADTARAVLAGYRSRYAALVDTVAETEPAFDDSRLATEPMIDLLVEPIYALAARWRQPPA